MRIDRAALIRGLAGAAGRERERRQAAARAEADAAREKVEGMIDAVAERMQAAPDWREPTAEEQRRTIEWLEVWCHRHGYPFG